ncbi:matrixin family metalloprotease [Arthrobacter crystallopoietes]|uniref:matrixin family metalloprotease n=1 Tax=Crystallibacter crystallopoietes TaxID=37928 RepID=UPI001ABE2892|nr:matrixin family metalloprotease [Arthrobacter crystallopoietes]QTG79652.1 matrixin family metalloprotease [Arthrobacter crystallopoietes]
MPHSRGGRPHPPPAGDVSRRVTGTPEGLRRSASGRVPLWALDEGTGEEPLPAGWRTPPVPADFPVSPRTQHRRNQGGLHRNRRHPLWLTIAVSITVVGALLLAPAVGSRALNALPAFLAAADMPPPGVEAADAPLGTPPAASGSDQYRFLEFDGLDQPFVAFDPCRPIHYAVRAEGAPAGGAEMIEEAVGIISEASGLQFINDGETTEAPRSQRPKYQPDRYGERWAPVLIAWSTPADNPDLGGDTIGLGGSSPVGLEGETMVYVTGQVELDGPQMREVLQYPDGWEGARSVVVHELGHVLGLDHVDDPGQLMYAGGNSQTQLADGDRAGLALLGQGECVPEL